MLQDRGVVLRSLRENIDFSTPTGRMMAGIFTCLAEYERGLIKERAAAARRAAAAHGRETGHARSLDEDRTQLARRMFENDENVSVIACTLSVS